MKADSNEIPLSGFDLNAVTSFLEFIYKERTDLNMEIDSLLQLCYEYLIKNINQENVFNYIEISTKYELSKNLMDKWDKCSFVINTSQLELIKTESFFRMSKRGLTTFLEIGDYLEKKEIEIYHAVNQWSEHFCKKHGETVNSENKIDALGETLNHIRFGSMTFTEFMECTTTESPLLTDKQTLGIFKCIGTNGRTECEFSSFHRNGNRYNRFKKHMEIIFDQSIPLKPDVTYYCAIEAKADYIFQYRQYEEKKYTVNGGVQFSLFFNSYFIAAILG